MSLGRLVRPPSCRPLHGSSPSPKYVLPCLSLQSRQQLPHRRLPSYTALHPRCQAHKRVEVEQRAEPRTAAEATAAETMAGVAAGAVLQDEVERSRQHIKEEQRRLADSHAEPYDLAKTRRIVETAMLAAVTGLAYTLATLLKLESYLGYFLPLPVIISALQSGPTAGLKTVTTAFLLLFILMGPVKALTYLLIYGVLSLVLGTCWSLKLPWALCIPLASGARVAGYLVYVKLASWVTNEDLMMLLITSVHSLLDQISSNLGAAGAPSMLTVSITICSLLLVNALVYVGMMHVLFAVLLRGMGLEISPMPAVVQRYIYRGGLQQAGLQQQK